TGSMNLIDLGIMQNLWEPIAALEALNRASSTKTAAKQRAADKDRQSAKLLASILQNLPHSIQLRLFNADEQAWASLRREYLTVNAEDFPLKHGPSIQGKWHCLAILDGEPYSEDEGINIPDGASELESAMWEMSLQLRVMLGRGMQDYGLTPIALFRSMSKQ